jgi:hypothetical protein
VVRSREQECRRRGALKLVSIAKNEVLGKLLTPITVGEAGNLPAAAKTGDFHPLRILPGSL